ncbi:MAG TPA: PQQ-binding-like beta-propeller repeat protein, partial [Myxococcaceae bacterium]|nr:PQQ-binding-like beta-propeller repeat protein [Myxococcaceae bacterium]
AFTAPVVGWGRRFLAASGRPGQTLLFAADADTGNVLWSRELGLGATSAPLGVGQRVYLGGERDGQPLLLAFNAKGDPVWERRLGTGGGPLSLLPTPGGVVVSGRSGAACRVESSGKMAWVLGAAGAELRRPLAPKLMRRILFIPGETVRAVELSSGAVLAEVKMGSGLQDLAVDTRLGLYLLNDEGGVRAFRVASHLAVVGGPRRSRPRRADAT